MTQIFHLYLGVFLDDYDFTLRKDELYSRCRWRHNGSIVKSVANEIFYELETKTFEQSLDSIGGPPLHRDQLGKS